MLHFVPKVSSTLVALCLKLDLNEFVISKLSSNKPCGCPELADASELTAFSVAAFEQLRDKILSEPLCNIVCYRMAYIDDHLVILMTSKGSTSGITKVLTYAKVLTMVNQLYSRYSEKMKLLGGKAVRDEFDWCCKTFVGALQTATLNVYGKVDRVKKDVVDSKLKELHAKAKEVKCGSGKAPAKRERSETSYPMIKVSGESAAVLYHMISVMMKLPVTRGNKFVSVNVVKPDLEGIKQRINDNADKYIAKVSKLSDESLTYMLVGLGVLDPCKKVKVKDLSKYLSLK